MPELETTPPVEERIHETEAHDGEEREEGEESDEYDEEVDGEEEVQIRLARLFSPVLNVTCAVQEEDDGSDNEEVR